MQETSLESLMAKYGAPLPISAMNKSSRTRDFIPVSGPIPADAPGMKLDEHFIRRVMDFAEPACAPCVPAREQLADELRFRPHLGAVAIAALLDEKRPCTHLSVAE